METRQSLSGLAIRFFAMAVVLLTFAGLCAAALPRAPYLAGQRPGIIFPPIFGISTVCLLYGSWALSQAKFYVVHERQIPFRHCLWRALAAGTSFVAVQSYALANFFEQQPAVQASTGVTAFVAVAAGLHGMHFLVAWLFLLFVTLQAEADRYDHEYHWGLTFCVWFWHALGIVWLAVLCVMAIANQGLIEDGVSWDQNLQ